MGVYSISEDVTPPGARAPRHKHTREVETFIVLEDEYEFQCGDRMFKGSKEAMVVLPKEIPHAFKNIGNTIGRTLLVLVPGGMEKVFEDLSAMLPGLPDLGIARCLRQELVLSPKKLGVSESQAYTVFKQISS